MCAGGLLRYEGLVTAEHPYASFLHRVQKPSRYVGGEHGETRKDWNEVSGRFCLAFPDIYDIGMSHLGFKILYSILNGHHQRCTVAVRMLLLLEVICSTDTEGRRYA